MAAFSVNTELLGQLLGSLLQGANNTVEKVIVKKLESLTKEVFTDLLLATPFGAGLGAGLSASKRFATAIETGGQSEFKRARAQWLNAIIKAPDKFSQSGPSGRIGKAIKDAAIKARQGTQPENGHWKWSRSRREWLNEDWRHDWRSQPRDKRGRWIPGRLNSIYLSQTVRKRRASRRKFIRNKVKEMMRGD